MGPKIQAKEQAKLAGVPVVPGYEGDLQDVGRFAWEAGEIGYPVLLKASAGGGGRGMRIVNSAKELPEAFEAAKREAENAFGDGKLLLEKYFEHAKHIEVQIFGDNHGNYIHLFERECSVQRRYQKIIEESPSPSLSPEQRLEICEAAKNLAASVGYNNAGTVEFLLAPDGQFYFLEVNTRLQVEHPVTESVTGLDLVKMQLGIASGESLDHMVQEPTQFGAAIECRICAEDPYNNFAPSTGQIGFFGTEETMYGARIDTGVDTDSEISVFYDSMVAKFITSSVSREEARRQMVNQLETFPISGIRTNTSLLINILEHPDFSNASIDTKWIERNLDSLTQIVIDDEAEFISACLSVICEINDPEISVNYDKSLSGWRNSHYQDQYKIFSVNGNDIKVQYQQLPDGSLSVKQGDKYISVSAADLLSEFTTITFDGHIHKTPSRIAADNNLHIWMAGKGAFVCQEVPRFKQIEQETTGDYKCPMPGEVVKLLVSVGDKVEAGQGLLVLSSMKMESTIEANESGEVKEIYVTEKQFVEAGKELLKVE